MMRPYALLSLAFSLAFSLTATATAIAQRANDLDAKNGFRDVVFGDTISKFKGMKLEEDDGDSKYYIRKSDDLTAGAARISKIVYGFYKGRASSVTVSTHGYTNSRALLQILTQLYGDGDQPNEYLEKYYWSSPKVDLIYDENSITNDAKVFYISNTMAAQEEEDKRVESIRSGGKF